MKARAVVFENRREVAFHEVAVPEPGDNDVLVQTRFSWISNGTEGSFLRGERVNGETPYTPGAPWPFPIVAGYQSTGVVMHVGRAVTDLRPGQWVFCTLGRGDGMYEPGGGHVSPKVVDRSQIWSLEPSDSPAGVSGLVLTQVGYNCGARPSVHVGDVAVVVGDGMVGHGAAQTLHWRGAQVILAGKHDDRLARFPETLGRKLNVSGVAIAEALRAIVPDGIDILVDTVGTLETVRACLPLMRQDGHVVSAGFNRTDSLLDIQRLRFGELTFHSPSGWQKKRMDETLALIRMGHLQTEPLITHRFPVERAAESWRLILERSEPVLGVVLEWGGV
ncbi:MAG: zinc-binding dehydrogenase [Candidatus Hydrogenedentes bacterium]|nr:zinc-binding dehydrogenase [Candidatus Hydrogenedentota bacterium]